MKMVKNGNLEFMKFQSLIEDIVMNLLIVKIKLKLIL